MISRRERLVSSQCRVYLQYTGASWDALLALGKVAVYVQARNEDEAGRE